MATMLYWGIGGAIGSVDGVDTDGNNVIRRRQRGRWGCGPAAPTPPRQDGGATGDTATKTGSLK